MKKKRLLIDLLVLAVLITAGCAFLPYRAQSMFYYPDQVDTGESPADEGLKFEVANFPSIASSKVPGSVFLMNDVYSANRHIGALSSIPLLFIHGTADDVIPYEQGQRLFEAASSPKLFITVPGGGHIMALSGAYGTTYMNQVIAFFEAALQTCPFDKN